MNINTMKSSKFTITMTGAAMAIALSAGSALALNAGPDHTKKEASKTMHTQQDGTAWLTLVRSDQIMGADVIGTNNEEVGSIHDLIIDRGTGRVAFAVIGYGGLLTIGENLFATEYGKLEYSPTEERFSIAMNKEQAQRQIEFLPENWKDLSQSGWMDGLTSIMSDKDTNRYGKADMAKSETMKINGTVTEIKHDEQGNNEDVVVCLEDQNGETREVVLGPSWYIMGLDTAPSINDRVELVAAKHDGHLIATNARVSGKELKLRDSDGTVYWNSTSHKTPRYVLLSDLIGRNIEIGGSTGGEIQNLVIEATSGRVAFFGFDPNENFLGLGDQVSLVPWSAMHIASDLTVWSQADASVFGSAMPMPEKLSTLRTRSAVKDAYTRFGLNTPDFSKPASPATGEQSRMDANQTGNAWSGDSSLVKAFAKGDSIRLTGEFIRMDTAELNNGAVTASSMWIQTSEGKQQVILGPDWFVDRQDMKLQKGDKVTISGRSAQIDGTKYIAAWNINQSKTTWALWNDSTPAWVD